MRIKKVDYNINFFVITIAFTIISLGES